MKKITNYRAFLMISLFIASSVVLHAQHQNVVISSSQGFGLPTEPAVIMNPSNTDEIMVAGIM